MSTACDPQPTKAGSLMPEIEATRQVGAGTKFTDRSGRVWECKSYNSPSGPAFWLTLPEELAPAGTGGYTVHFDGVMGVSQRAGQ